MPNTAVKPANAESTWGEAPWEDRKPLIQKERIRHVYVLFLYMAASYLLRYVIPMWQKLSIRSPEGDTLNK